MTVPVSVLMPARNARSTVVAAVRSTLRALSPSDELLVLDDASTDDTAALLERIRDRRLGIVRTDVGLGVAQGLNRLLHEARSPLVARMDADDLALPLRFRLQRAVMGGRDLAFGNILPFGQRRARISASSLVALGQRDLSVWWLLENPTAHSAMIARRASLLEVGGYRDMPTEDWDLWLRMATAGMSVWRGAVPVTAYRLHAGQVSTSAVYRTAIESDARLASSWRGLLDALGYSGAADASFQDRLRRGSPVHEWLTEQAAELRADRRFVLARRLVAVAR